MQELFRTQSSANNEEPGLVLGLATTPEELEALQRLRFDVYTKEMGVIFPDSENGIDKDYFDEFCEHLMVCDLQTNQVIGTYRMMNPIEAKRAGGYYSESEFDLSELDNIRDVLTECGRSCIHPDYRNGATIMLLWAGLIRYLQQTQGRYILGCASVSLMDGGRQAAKVWQDAKKQLALHPELFRVKPLTPYPLDKLPILEDGEEIKIPPLIKGYLKTGARICGEPAWDKHFNSADFPVIIDVQNMDKRYQKHFGL
ncbi:GNAT family N-acetyltransferase [Pelistega sp. NLN82]|uniref:L-ornithine N(alpha)-acyltransferase n=1 Tax=Pelistega ratti TaxID=2652177 RepID=A0A6L9Y7Q0_9BURK|nr:GNAT family N-acyltransferase [Pelistega ratti]NEN75808.1 GNAT family N-acetyltransferase [Pelistega ratti]